MSACLDGLRIANAWKRAELLEFVRRVPEEWALSKLIALI